MREKWPQNHVEVAARCGIGGRALKHSTDLDTTTPKAHQSARTIEQREADHRHSTQSRYTDTAQSQHANQHEKSNSGMQTTVMVHTPNIHSTVTAHQSARTIEKRGADHAMRHCSDGVAGGKKRTMMSKR